MNKTIEQKSSAVRTFLEIVRRPCLELMAFPWLAEFV